MAIVSWRKKSVKVVPILNDTGSVIKQVILLNGWNDIEDVDWIKARIHVLPLIEKGIITEKGEMKKKDGEDVASFPKVTIKSLKLEEALETVFNTGNPATLEKWKKIETRDEVRKAINDEIEEVHKMIPLKEVPKIARREFFVTKKEEE